MTKTITFITSLQNPNEPINVTWNTGTFNHYMVQKPNRQPTYAQPPCKCDNLYITILLVSRGFSFLNHSTLSVGSPTGIRRHSKWAVCPSAIASMFWSGCVNTGRCRVCGSWISGRWNGVVPSSWRIFSRPSGRCDSSIMLLFAARWKHTLTNNCSKWNML